MADTLLNRILNLQKENDYLRMELDAAEKERDAWKDKAVEMMHLVTYTSEKLNHKGLELIKKGKVNEYCRNEL